MNSGLALGYVFGLGMVAVFNPCGFAMLPAWVAYFVASDQGSTTAHRGVLRALAVGAVLTAGFVAVFLVVGLMIQLTASSLVSRLPWLSIALGAAMVLLSIWLFRGRELNMPNPWARRGPRSRAHREVFLFGVSYAFVSLTCTIPLFLAGRNHQPDHGQHPSRHPSLRRLRLRHGFDPDRPHSRRLART